MKTKAMAILILFLAGISLSVAMHAQSITVSGTANDTNGNKLNGVNVLETGTKNRTATDVNGQYKIIVQKGAKLQFSCVGFTSQIVEVKSEKLDVILKEDTTTLNEVVVVGYGTIRKQHIAGSVSNISSSLQGHVRGVYAGNGYYHMKHAKRQEGEKYTEITENKFIKVANEPLSTFSADVDKASYSNIRSYINGGQLPPKDAVRIEEMINYFKYNYEAPTDGQPVKFHTEIGDCPWNKDSRLVKIGLKARETGIKKDSEQKDLPRTSLVFLIDISGSMSGDNRLGLVQKSMKLLLDQLRPDDRVAIVTYASGTEVKLESTPVRQKEKIVAALDALKAGGSTSGGAGIQLAYDIAVKNFVKNGNNRVILCTDGDFNVGISEPKKLKELIEEKRKTGVFLSVFGYGMYNYRDDMVQTLSKAGNGNYAYINDLMEANRVMVDQFLGTMYTIAKDVKLQVEFNPLKVDSYRLVGYELRLLAKEDFNDDTKDAGDMGIGHTVTAFYEIIPSDTGKKLKDDQELKQTKKSKKKKDRPEVDSLKYQTSVPTGSDELLTVKMRYKDPLDEDSRMISAVLSDNGGNNTTEDFRFASAVARFGMLLRNTEDIKTEEFDDIAKIASESYGEDEGGYRREFVRLVNLAKDIIKIQVAK